MKNKKIVISTFLISLSAVCMCACDKDTYAKKTSQEITSSTKAEDIADESGEKLDIVSGNCFICSDNSEIQMQEDGSFMYYRTKDDYDGDYYKGTYEVYRGQEAVDKIISMKEYGLTEDEIERIIDANKKGYHLGDVSGGNSLSYMLDGDSASDVQTYDVSKDVFYCIILHNQTLYMGGKNEEINHDSVYIGYYIEELKTMDLLNIVAVHPARWILQ